MAKIYLTKVPSHKGNCWDKNAKLCHFQRGTCMISYEIKKQIGDCTYPGQIIFKFHHREAK